jgi:hypothetical protein
VAIAHQCHELLDGFVTEQGIKIYRHVGTPESLRIEKDELFHGTSSHVISLALQENRFKGSRAYDFLKVALKKHSNEIQEDFRLIYAYQAYGSERKNKTKRRYRSQEGQIFSSAGYAETSSLGHDFAQKLGVDLMDLDSEFVLDLSIIRRLEDDFNGLIDYYSKDSEFPDPTRADVLKRILGDRSEADIDRLIEDSKPYKGVIIVFKRSTDQAYKVIPDPETDDQRGAVIITKSGLPIDQIDRIYALSEHDYSLLTLISDQ